MIICQGIAVVEVIEEIEDDEDEDGEEVTSTRSYTIEIMGEDLDWESEGQGEREMGAEIHHYGTYDFGEGDITWTVYEYPEGSLSGKPQVEINGNGELVKDFDGFSFTP